MALYDIVATTAFGIEAIAAKEFKDLGYKDLTVENGNITFQGDEEAIMKANLWSRCADRIYIKIGEFEATTFEELFQKTKALPWSKYLPIDAEFPVSDAKSVKSKLFSLSDIQAIVKKATVESLKLTYKQDWFSEKGAKYPIHVWLHKDKATILLNTSGAALHRRGYREKGSEAPLKETLAAALIKISKWTPEYPLIDPMCGSGTIPIEAALIAKNIAPGIRRKFACEDWHMMPGDVISKCRNEAIRSIKRDLELKIHGSDINRRVTNIARDNAIKAGVGDYIHFQQLDVYDISSRKKEGFIICNPPYGERLNNDDEIQELYKTMGKKFNELPEWNKFIITSYERFEKFYGSKADKNRKLYNGRLKCYYYQYIPQKNQK